MKERRRLLGLLLAVATAAASLTWWLGTRVESPRQAAAEAAAPEASQILAPVEFRRLRVVVALPGRVRGPDETKIAIEPSGEGAPIVTAEPLPLGALVDEGSVVAEVAARPVIVFVGAMPMFRDLKLGSTGRDVAQLQLALQRRGFVVGDTPGALGVSTASAVARFYSYRGYEAPPGAPARPGKRNGAVEEAVVVPRSEVVFVRTLPAQLASRSQRVGQKVSGSVVSLATGSPIVQAHLPITDRDKVRIGARASVEVGGRRIRAAVVSFGGLATNRGVRGYPVSLRPARALSRRLVGRDVRVVISVKSTRRRVLVVPVSAMSESADGSVQITRVRAGENRRLDVEPLLSANGYVALRSPQGGLTRHDDVLIGY